MSDRYNRMLIAAPPGFDVARTGELADGTLNGRYVSIIQKSKNCFVVTVKGFPPVRCCDADSVSALFQML